MTRKKPEDLSVQEIRFLLVAKRRMWRRSRLEQFYRTGRVFPLANEVEIVADVSHAVPTPLTKRQHVDASERSWLDYLLLVTELLIIVGIIAVVVNTLSTLGNLKGNNATMIVILNFVGTFWSLSPLFALELDLRAPARPAIQVEDSTCNLLQTFST